MDRTSIDEGFDVGCMKLYEALIQTSRHEDNDANSFVGLWGPRPWTTTSCLGFYAPLANFALPQRIHFRCARAQNFLGLGFASATKFRDIILVR
jgi:hypothetical protein